MKASNNQISNLLPPFNLPYRIKLLSLNNEKRLLAVLEPFNVTPMQYGVLCCLWQEDGLATTEIADTLKALGGTLTLVLDGLESRNLVRRKRDPSDKIISRVYLNKDGKMLEQKLLKQVIHLQEEIFQTLTAEELNQLSVILDKLLT
jgi:DNA-binding MarR family transcriptional regulator